jgi:hypothetical protein
MCSALQKYHKTLYKFHLGGPWVQPLNISEVPEFSWSLIESCLEAVHSYGVRKYHKGRSPEMRQKCMWALSEAMVQLKSHLTPPQPVSSKPAGTLTIHPRSTNKYDDWRLISTDGEVMVITDSLFQPATVIPQRCHVQVFPGAKYSHLSHLIKHYDGQYPRCIIIAAGINHRDKNNVCSVIDELHQAVMAAYELTDDVRVAEVTYCHSVPQSIPGGLCALNDHICHNYISLPPAPIDYLFTTGDKVHLKSKTVDYILDMWKTFL